MADIVRMYVARERPGIDLTKVYVSAHILAALYEDGLMAYEAIDSSLEGKKVYETYSRPDSFYALGGARDAINEAVSIERARGKYLSRPIMSSDGRVLVTAGTQVTDDVLSICYRNFINELYLKAQPDVIGYKLAANGDNPGASHNVMIGALKQGCPINDFIRSYLPESMQSDYALRHNAVFSPNVADTHLDGNILYIKGDPIIIGEGTVISLELAEILPYIGRDIVWVSRVTVTSQ